MHALRMRDLYRCTFWSLARLLHFFYYQASRQKVIVSILLQVALGKRVGRAVALWLYDSSVDRGRSWKDAHNFQNIFTSSWHQMWPKLLKDPAIMETNESKRKFWDALIIALKSFAFCGSNLTSCSEFCAVILFLTTYHQLDANRWTLTKWNSTSLLFIISSYSLLGLWRQILVSMHYLIESWLSHVFIFPQ